MTTSFSLRTLSRADILENLSPLSDILADCVNSGASVSFMLPFSLQTARTFWLRIAESVAAGSASCWWPNRPGRLSARYKLVIDQPENQPHRADVAKLLVHQNARRQGLLMPDELPGAACPRAGQVGTGADTATGSGAERFYVQCGWEKAGEIPRYALMPDGAMTATSLFYKIL
ncbi:Acetyltransferase [Raoultella planticola]|uniref:Acetyltransferase n=1 Tax=Raoultella planticola TaxID=575 RepID=A0A485A4Z5_RAOPL|nr:Acetyltransferase [Raoultella planticola]